MEKWSFALATIHSEAISDCMTPLEIVGTPDLCTYTYHLPAAYADSGARTNEQLTSVERGREEKGENPLSVHTYLGTLLISSSKLPTPKKSLACSCGY